MPFPVFASGDVLNASDMNAVGLWLVKSQTIGSAVSSVSVTGAFSSDYENYFITVSGGVASGNCDLGIQIGAATTNYVFMLAYGDFGAGAWTKTGSTTGSSIQYVGSGDTNKLQASVTLYGPQLAKNTLFTSQWGRWTTTGISGVYQGFLNNSTQYTDFSLVPSTGTITGGTIRVYGFRN